MPNLCPFFEGDSLEHPVSSKSSLPEFLDFVTFWVWTILVANKKFQDIFELSTRSEVRKLRSRVLPVELLSPSVRSCAPRVKEPVEVRGRGEGRIGLETFG